MVARRIARLRNDASGATAVEFAMIAPLLFALLIGTFDLGGLMIRTMLFERALEFGVRPLRVGDDGAPTDAASLKKSVCGRTIIKLRDCESRLTIEMTPIKKKSDIPTADVACVTRSVPKPSVPYSQGGASELVYVRACLTVDPFVAISGSLFGLPRTSEGNFRIVAGTAFTNEP